MTDYTMLTPNIIKCIDGDWEHFLVKRWLRLSVRVTEYRFLRVFHLADVDMRSQRENKPPMDHDYAHEKSRYEALKEFERAGYARAHLDSVSRAPHPMTLRLTGKGEFVQDRCVDSLPLEDGERRESFRQIDIELFDHAGENELAGRILHLSAGSGMAASLTAEIYVPPMILGELRQECEGGRPLILELVAHLFQDSPDFSEPHQHQGFAIPANESCSAVIEWIRPADDD